MKAKITGMLRERRKNVGLRIRLATEQINREECKTRIRNLLGDGIKNAANERAEHKINAKQKYEGSEE